MPIYKKFQSTTGTKAKRPKIKAKASENPVIDAMESEIKFMKADTERKTKLSKANPAHTYLSLYHH
jgi:hypothetical protein